MSTLLSKFGIRTHRSFRLTLRGIALALGLIAGFGTSVLIEQGNFQSASVVFLVVISSAILEFVFGDVLADQSFPYDTERKLSLMEKRLGSKAIEAMSSSLQQTIDGFKGCDPAIVSATVHIKAELNPTNDSSVRYGLLQLTDYVGPLGGKKGRVTQINQGVIGRCARTEKVETVDFADEEEYQSSMVREFGFTKDEAKRHTNSARSYLAYPLMRGNDLVGVVYFFTEEPQVFPNATNDANLNGLAQEFVRILSITELA